MLTVNDGNHRLEALNRLGRSEFPAILWTTGEKNREALENLCAQWRS